MSLKVCEKSEGLKTPTSAIHIHLVNNCYFTLKSEKTTAVRDSDRAIALRKAIIEQFQSMKDLNFIKKCIFVDKAGFNLHTEKLWSLIERQTCKDHSTNRKRCFIILNAIYQLKKQKQSQ